MTKNEAFKKRIRARMAATSERYGAARRVLLARRQADAVGEGWVSAPEMNDDRIEAGTGSRWDDWVAAIDAGPGREASHTAIATWLRSERGVDAWWAQGVTVGYERIVGRRLPGQLADGTFSVSRTRTLVLDALELRAALLDADSRADLLPGLTATPRSKPTAKSLRFGLVDTASGESVGVAARTIDAVPKGARVNVTHELLSDASAAEAWKSFWASWLEDLAGSS